MLPWSPEAPPLRAVARARRCATTLAALLVAGALAGLAAVATVADSSAARVPGPIGPTPHDPQGSAAATAALVLTALSAALLATIATLVLGLAAWKEVPRLLATRRPKPTPRRFLAAAMLSVLVCAGLAIATLATPGSPAALRAVSGAILALALCGAGYFGLTWLVDVELFKPLDSPYDSVILYYARCLCWSPTRRRFIFAALPFYMLTLISVCYCIADWQGRRDDDGSVTPSVSCTAPRREFLLVATCLFVLYSGVVTWMVTIPTMSHGYQRVCCLPGRRASQVILGLVVASSLGWGAIGSAYLFDGDCSVRQDHYWHFTRAMHVLLILLGCVLLVLGSLCNLESNLVDYYHYSSSEEGIEEVTFANGFRQLILGANGAAELRRTALFFGESTDDENDDGADYDYGEGYGPSPTSAMRTELALPATGDRIVPELIAQLRVPEDGGHLGLGQRSQDSGDAFENVDIVLQ